MPELKEFTMILQQAGVGLILIILTVACKQISNAIKTKYLNEAELKKVDALEKAAFAAVRAADQKFGDVSKFVTEILGDQPTGNELADYTIQYNEMYKRYKQATNEQKKDMVLDFLESKFPDVPFDEIEIQLERAYKEYKESRN